jgi:hypothetical protein
MTPFNVAEVTQPLPEGLQQGIGSRGRDAGIEPTNPVDFPQRLRRGGKCHHEDTQRKDDDTSHRTAPHETFLLCCWLISCPTAFTSSYRMVMSTWKPNY